MLNERLKVPDIAYFSLSQVERFTGFSCDDVLSVASEGKIALCFKFDDAVRLEFDVLRRAPIEEKRVFYRHLDGLGILKSHFIGEAWYSLVSVDVKLFNGTGLQQECIIINASDIADSLMESPVFCGNDFCFSVCLFIGGLWQIPAYDVCMIPKDENADFHLFPYGTDTETFLAVPVLEKTVFENRVIRWGSDNKYHNRNSVAHLLADYDEDFGNRFLQPLSNGFRGGLDFVRVPRNELIKFIQVMNGENIIQETASVSDDKPFKPGNIEKAMLLELIEETGEDYKETDILKEAKENNISYEKVLLDKLLAAKRKNKGRFSQNDLAECLETNYSDLSETNNYKFKGLSVSKITKYFPTIK